MRTEALGRFDTFERAAGAFRAAVPYMDPAPSESRLSGGR